MENLKTAYTEFEKGVFDIQDVLGGNSKITLNGNKSLNGDEYKSGIELSSDAIFIGDRQGKVISWNDAMENLTGVKHADAIDQNMWDVIFKLTPKEYQNPSLLSSLKKRFLGILSDWAYWQKKVYEHRITDINGSALTVELSTFVSASPNGNLLVAVLREIGSQKQAEMALSLQSEALSKLNQFAIELSKLSLEDNIEALISLRIKEFTGAIGVVFSEYVAENRTLTPKHIELEPGMLEIIVNMFDKHVHKIHSILRDYMYQELTSTTIRISSSLFEVSLGAIPYSVGAAAQSMLMADRFIRVSYLIDGKLYGTSLIALGKHQPDPPTEILEDFVFLAASAIKRRRTEESLRKSEEILRAITENAADIIWNLDEEGTILFTNRIMPGYEKKDILGRNFCEWTLPEYHDLMAESLECVFSKAISQTYQSRAVGVDHEIRWYLSRLSPVTIDGEVKNAVLSITDITDKKQEEEALRVSEENYRVIAQSTFDAIFIIDRFGKQLFFNKSVERVLGYKIEEVVGRSFSDFLPEDCVAEYLKQLGNIFLYKEVSKFVTSMYHKDGYLIDVEINIKLVKLKGEYVGQGSIRDITAKKHSEEKFKNSIERNNALLKAIPDLMLVFDSNCKIVDFHSESNGLLSDEPERYLGKQIDDIFPKEVAAIMHKKVGKVLSTGNANYSTYEMQVGGVPKYFESRYVLCGKNEVLSMVRDITQQKHSESALNIAKESYLGVFDSVPEAIYILDESGTYIDVNKGAEKMYQLDKQEFIGKKPEMIAYPGRNDLDEIQNLIDKVVETGVPERFEFWAQRKNGEVFLEEIMINKGKYFGKNVLIASARDITEQKQAEERIKLKNEELLNINSEKDKFFSIIAHDLRSPFNSFLGLTQIMAEDLPNMSFAEIQTIAVSMSKSADNLYGLLENLLEWSRFQRGMISFDPKELPLLSKTKEIIQSLMDSANKKDLEIVFDLPEGSTVFADEYMFSSIFRNLTSNSIKFTPKGGTISLSAKSDENDAVEFAIRDNGIGMEEKMVKKLFCLDEYTNRQGTEGEPSTGLGLVLCKEFVEKHGGKIWVESEEEKGSTFYFTIPNQSSPVKDSDLNLL